LQALLRAFGRHCRELKPPQDALLRASGVLPSIPSREAESPRATGRPARTQRIKLALAYICAHNVLNLFDLYLIEIKMENQDRDSSPGHLARHGNEASTGTTGYNASTDDPRNQPRVANPKPPAPLATKPQVVTPAIKPQANPGNKALLRWTTLLLWMTCSGGQPCSYG
jgi:hypothetical protein